MQSEMSSHRDACTLGAQDGPGDAPFADGRKLQKKDGVSHDDRDGSRTQSSRAARRSRAPAAVPSVRVGFASFLRISDNLVSRVVDFYDGLFDLESEDQGQLYLDLGRQLMADGRPDEALQLFRRATRARPEDPAGWVELGRHYLRRKAPKAAVTALEKALETGIESAKIHRCLADALQQQDKLAEAEVELERGLALDPDSPECWFDIGVLRDTRGELEPALDAFARAVSLAPKRIPYHQRLGFALESVGRRKDAIESFKAALDLESDTKRGG